MSSRLISTHDVSVRTTNLTDLIYIVVSTDCDINLGFVLDGSASVEGTKRGNFLKMINFVKDTIHTFVELSQQVHVGTLVYSTNSSLILSFGTKGTEKVIDQILDNIHYPGLYQ